MTNPSIPGVPRSVTKTIVIILIGIKIFTPDNIKDNAELDELGISYEYMVETFQTNEAYLDAVLFYQDSEDYIEIFVRKT